MDIKKNEFNEINKEELKKVQEKKKFDETLIPKDDFVRRAQLGPDGKPIEGGGSSVIPNPELVGDEPELNGLEVEGAKYKVPEQKQADWNQSDAEAKDFIKNKPTIPAAQKQADWNQGNDQEPDFIKNKPSIPTVNNATITFTQGGVNKGSINLNQSDPATIALDAGGSGGDGDLKNEDVISSGLKIKRYKKPSKWVPKRWSGLTNFNGNNVWFIDDQVYYSDYTDHYYLDKETSTWIPVTWYGLAYFYGAYVWTDGTNIFYYADSINYILNRKDCTWVIRPIDNTPAGFDPRKVWFNGDDVYYTEYGMNKQFCLDKKNWIWSGVNVAGLSGSDIWSDGTDIYYSNGSTQKVLNRVTMEWSSKTWLGNIPQLNGGYIWTDGNNMYYSAGAYQYVLDKGTSTWYSKTWEGLSGFSSAGPIWSDGNKVYYSSGEDQYELVYDCIDIVNEVEVNKDVPVYNRKKRINSVKVNGSWFINDRESIKSVLGKNCHKWVDVAEDFVFTDMKHVWTDGKHIYYDSSYRFDRVNKKFVPFNVPTPDSRSISGYYVWTDGEDIFFSPGNHIHFQLVNGEWVSVSFDNDDNIEGRYVWTDGTNTYVSSGANHYVLNKNTMSWESKTWYGLTHFSADNLWTDGENIYYSNNYSQYILDIETSTWYFKTWYGRQTFTGNQVWTDGTDIYLSTWNRHFILDRSSSMWIQTGFDWGDFQGNNVWTDGTNIYRSEGSILREFINTSINMRPSIGSPTGFSYGITQPSTFTSLEFCSQRYDGDTPKKSFGIAYLKKVLCMDFGVLDSPFYSNTSLISGTGSINNIQICFCPQVYQRGLNTSPNIIEGMFTIDIKNLGSSQFEIKIYNWDFSISVAPTELWSTTQTLSVDVKLGDFLDRLNTWYVQSEQGIEFDLPIAFNPIGNSRPDLFNNTVLIYRKWDQVSDTEFIRVRDIDELIRNLIVDIPESSSSS